MYVYISGVYSVYIYIWKVEIMYILASLPKKSGKISL